MNYYIFLKYNFRFIDNCIFNKIKDPNIIFVIYIKSNSNYFRKNNLLDYSWNIFAEKLIQIGIECYEFTGDTEELNVVINNIKKNHNNIILEDSPTLLFPILKKEYKLCRPFFNYNIKNTIVEICDSESFFKKKYIFERINIDNLKLSNFKNNNNIKDKKNIQDIWQDILESDLIPLYLEKRDYLDAQYTSHLSMYINSGQISIRQIWCDTIKKYNNDGAMKFLSELGWRDFAYHQFYYHPDMTWKNLNPKVNFSYSDDNFLFDNWKHGKTGVRIIDAGMNQLREEGWIPNRIRMLVASFLTKNLKISWQKGAEYFLEQLIDADPIINALNWQWVAGTGTDYMPYFRIFNPLLQAKKYDKDESYQNKWA